MKNKRVLLLLIAVVLLGAMGAGAVLYRQHSLNQAALEARDRGIEAAALGNHVMTLDGIGRYLQRFGQDTDPDAIHVYAMARREVPLPNNRHMQQAIPLFRRVIELAPDHPSARQDLLELYVQVGFGQEALTLAEEILAQNPGDRIALRGEVVTLARLQRFDEALEKSLALAEVAPDDIENHFLALQLLQRADPEGAQVLAYAEGQLERDPQNPRLQLVMSAAHDISGNRQAAIEWAERAASGADSESVFVSLLDSYLSRLGRYETALALLERTARESSDIDLLRTLARRQLEQGNAAEVLAILEEIPLEEQDPSIIGLGALAAVQAGETERVAGMVAELNQRGQDPSAQAWAPVLQKMFVDEDAPPQAVAAACEQAIQHDERNPQFHYFLGMAYERMGESALALNAWQRTVALSPAWLDPILRSASLLTAMGRNAEASQLALGALNRAPRNLNVAIGAAEVLGAGLDDLSAHDQGQLLDLVNRVQEASPMEPRTLALQVDLLALQGDRDEARTRVQQALNTGVNLPEGAFIQLARVSGKHDLGLETACYERVSEAPSAVPALALARATHALEAGDAEGGLALIKTSAEAAGNDIEWRSAVAQYLERMEAPEARAEWAAVAEAGKNSPEILHAVLNSRAAWQDFDLIEQVIENLRQQTGDAGIAWRVNKARWLLQSDPSDRAAAEASVLLSEVIQASIPRPQHFVLMANALTRLDNQQGAIDNLERAARLNPESTPVRLELARLYEVREDSERAAYHLDQVMRAGAVSRDEARAIAGMLARRGELNRAIQVLLRTYPPDDREAPADFMLAQLYRQAGNADRSDAIIQRLLEEAPDAPVIAFAADALAAQDRMDDARALLARLDGLEIPAGMRELILAEHERFHGSPEEATKFYLDATAAAPENAEIWRRTLAFLARTNQPDTFLETLPRAHAAVPGDAWLASLVQRENLLADTLQRPLALPLTVAAVESPEYREEAVEALQIISNTSSEDGDRLAILLRQLSDRYPRFLTLRMQLVRLYGVMGRHADAATLAMDAMRAFPNEVEPVRLAAEAAAAAGQWNNALDAAEEWRRRSSGVPIDADLMIAQAQTQLNRSTEALRTIQPYLDLVEDDPGAFSPIQFQRAHALIRDGQFDEAASEMEPRLAESAQWRMAWLRLAVMEISDEDTCRDWFEQVTPHIPEDAMDEQLNLASAWFRLAGDHDQAGYRAKARTILEAVAQRPDATGQALQALAVVADSERNYQTAETTYRLALERDPTLLVASNNLAMILVNRNEDLDEALRLAQFAVDNIPDNAAFRDTLAQVHAAMGDYDTAIQHLSRAVELEPEDPQWRVSLENLVERQQESSGLAAVSR